MTKDKKSLLILSLSIFIVLFLVLFLKVSSQYTGLISILFAFLTLLFLKKEGMYSVNKQNAFWVSVIGAILFVAIYYLSCLYFGAKTSDLPLSWLSFIKVILPITLIIISTEIIRLKILAYNNKIANIFAFLICVISELFVFAKVISFDSFNMFMDIVGLILLPAFSSNYLYHKLTLNYGIYPSLSYRLISSLFVYLIPFMSNIPDALFVIYKLIYPLVFSMYIAMLFEKKVKIYNDKKSNATKLASTTVLIALTISIGMLISNSFSYGLLVIGSGSMSGELNKGDVIIYEKYEDQIINKGSIIVFAHGKSKIVHRVVDINNEDGQIRYVTKGDANDERDTGYITSSDIIGITSLKISYIGYPTVWLNEFFSK